MVDNRDLKTRNAIITFPFSIFCVECGWQQDIKNESCDKCHKELKTVNDDYCCLCGNEQ